MQKFNKGLLVLVSGLTLTSSLYAAETEMTKKSPIHTFVPTAYGEAAMSHHLKGGSNPEKDNRLDVTAKVGFTSFNKMLDSAVLFGVKRYFSHNQVYQKKIVFENVLTAYKNNYVAVQPYLLTALPFVDSSGVEHTTEGRFGLHLPASYELSTKQGPIKFGTYYDIAGKYNNNTTVPVTDLNGEPLDDKAFASSDDQALSLAGETPAESLGLVADKHGKYEGRPKSFVLRQELAGTVGYTPNFAKGLFFEWRTRHKAESQPRLVFDKATQKVTEQEGSMGLAEYRTNGATDHRVRAKYTFPNTAVYLQNDFTFKHASVGTDKFVYANVVAVGATLF